jgi:hypothetical protein
LGGGKKDLSMLFVYAGVDNYLEEGGRLGFVITQSVFKTKGAGDGFRQLSYVDGQKTVYLKPVVVHDLSEMQVFEGATNRTAVFVCEKRSRAFKYPVPYVQWDGPSRIEQEKLLKEVLDDTSRVMLGAQPVEQEKATSPWLTAPASVLTAVKKLSGRSKYTAFAGCTTWLNGVYWVRILEQRPDGKAFIENLHDIGKKKVERIQRTIEADLIYPLLRGRDVSAWHAEPSIRVLLVQDPKTRKGIPESHMKRSYPKTFFVSEGV